MEISENVCNAKIFEGDSSSSKKTAGSDQTTKKHQRLQLDTENKSVVHIGNTYVSESQPFMRDIPCMNMLMKGLGISFRENWLP